MSLPANFSNHIVYEDDYILVIDKPAGLMVEPDRNNHPNLLQQVKNYLKSNPSKETELYAQHIHRLDRPVSGIIVFAKQRSVLKNLSEQFAERKVKKYYQALTEHAPGKMMGRLEHWHRKEKKKAVLYDTQIDYSEKVILDYSISALPTGLFLWNIELYTGKYHQIRVQLANKGCPVIGDQLYGSDRSYKPDSIALHACKLIFSHPITDKELIFEKTIGF